jgi:alkaline phosphatase D
VAVAATQFPFAKARSAPARFTGYPFTLGVASGDPTSSGVVLWTRLAPSPLAGNGGMPDKPVTVEWEVSKNEAFTSVVARGEEIATYGDAHSVSDPGSIAPGHLVNGTRPLLQALKSPTRTCRRS